MTSINKWRGTFSSDYYIGLMVKGNISIDLPENIFKLSELTEITTTTVVKYTGMYIYGQTINMTCKGEKIDDAWTFKATYGAQTFIIKSKLISDNKIQGTYKTLNPSDYGTIILRKQHLIEN